MELIKIYLSFLNAKIYQIIQRLIYTKSYNSDCYQIVKD